MCFYVKLPYNIGNIVSWAVKVAGIAAIEPPEEPDPRKRSAHESPIHQAIRQSCLVAGVNPIYLFEWLLLRRDTTCYLSSTFR